MDGAILPLNFYCRNARLCLRKASFSKKANLLADELQHLRAFTTLVSRTIPLHPLYPDRKDEKPFVELQSQLPEAEGRISELEAEGPTARPAVVVVSTTDGKPGGCLKLEKSKERPSQRKGNSLLVSSPRSIPDSISRAEKRTTATNSPRAQPERVQPCENWSSNRSESYRFASKSAPSSQKTTPVTQRPRKASDSSAMDHHHHHHHHHHHGSKDHSWSQPTSIAAAGDITPQHANGGRDVPCLKSSGPVASTSSRTQGKGGSSCVHVPKMKGVAVELMQEGSVAVLHHHPSGLSPGSKCNIHGFQGGSCNQVTSKCCEAHYSSSSTMIPGVVSRCGGGKEMMSTRGAAAGAPMAAVPCKQKLAGSGNPSERGVVNGSEEDVEAMSIGVAAAGLTERELTRRCAQSNGTSGHQCEEACYRKPILVESGRGGLEGSEEHTDELNAEKNCREHHGQRHHYSDLLHGRHGHGGFTQGNRQYELDGESSQPQKLEEGNGRLYSERSNRARAGLGQGRCESGKLLLDARPVSAPRRMEGAAASGERVKFPKGERIDINVSNGRNRSNAMWTYKSRGVKGVKEDCDRFRNQMQVLKEKAEDSRIREVEVEGMVDRLQKCMVEEIDTAEDVVVATRKGARGELPKSHQTAVRLKERSEFENVYNTRPISPTDDGARGCKLHMSPPSPPLLPLPPHLHERPLVRWEPEVTKDAHKEFEARKTIPALTACLPSYSTSSSSSGSLLSSLSSLPLSHYIQKLQHLAPKSHLPSSSRALYTPASNAAAAAAAVSCCNPAHTALHHNILTTSASTLEPQSKYEPSTSDYNKPSPESLDTSSNRHVGDSEVDSGHLSCNNNKKSTAILLPTSTANNAHTANCPLTQQPQYNNHHHHHHHNNSCSSRFGSQGVVSRSPLSDTTSCQMVQAEQQQMGAILGCCTLAASHHLMI